MGFSFRKSFRIGKNLRINLSKKGLGLSGGVPGLRIGVGSGRKARVYGGIGALRFFKTIGDRASAARAPEAAEDDGCGGCCGLIVVGVIVLLGASSIVQLTGSRATSASRPADDERGPTPIVPPLPLLQVAAPQSPQVDRFPTVLDAQREAIRRHPDLAVAGSSVNLRVLAHVKRARNLRPQLFDTNDWPVILADEIAAP